MPLKIESRSQFVSLYFSAQFNLKWHLPQTVDYLEADHAVFLLNYYLSDGECFEKDLMALLKVFLCFDTANFNGLPF